MDATFRTMRTNNTDHSLKKIIHVLAFFCLIGSLTSQGQVASRGAASPGDAKLDSLKAISIEIRKIPEYYKYPLLVETLYDVTTFINKAANPNYPLVTIPPIDHGVNYRQLSPASVAGMKDIQSKIQVIPGRQESRLLTDALISITSAISKAEPH